MSDQHYVEELKQVWEMVKESFRETLSDTAINLWFGELEVVSLEGDRLRMSIPSEFKYKIVKSKYLPDIENAFRRFLGFDVKIDFFFNASPENDRKIIEQLALLTTQMDCDEIGIPHAEMKEVGEYPPDFRVEETDDGISILPTYNFEYTFENFIVGSTNKFAQAACVAVAKHPATNYNPLFIYGNSGLGKTHLMYATINYLHNHNPDIKIIYTKGEDFTNQMISCLANKSMDEFRDKYRKCDVLLIDDIQFIAGKVSTQEEFFHTFNALYEEKKQIILTSDRPPRDIKTLEDRLKSRFEWGLIADIEPPDLELRIAIIKKKAEQVNIVIPDEVLTFLAENLRSNIRQIEGAIKKLGALTFLSGKEISMDVARVCISELLGGAEPVNVTIEKIFTCVYNTYGIPREELIGSKRNKEIATARHVSIYLIRDMTDMSLPNIAKIYGRDHSTILSSINTVAQKIRIDPDFALEVSNLKKDVLNA